MQRLSIAKNEGPAEIVDRVINSQEKELVLVVPKGALLGNSAINFNLIKREALAAGKKVSVESVDENIIELARANGFEANHPLFEPTASRNSFSDIIPRKAEGDPPKKVPTKRKPISEKKIKIAETESPEPVKQEIASEKISPALLVETEKSSSKKKFPRLNFKPPFGLPGKRGAVVAVVLGVLIFSLWFLSGPLSRATITINLQKTPWEKTDNFVADVSLPRADPAKHMVPGQFFSVSKNLAKTFPASGAQEVSEKAKGKITIYNAFSSAQQTLVATTRFETPDGKIFRIVKQIIVPGAIVKDGKITPSGIDADIAADQPGPSYNVGAIAKLTVPGFKGSPRYDGFYGEIKSGTSGGFVGKKQVPTADDLKKAQAEVENDLRSGLKLALLGGYPKGFEILDKVADSVSRIEISRLNINQETDAKGNFSIFGEAKISAIGFREDDLRSVLEVAASNGQNLAFKELSFVYSNFKPNFDKKTISFSLASKGILWPKFSAEDFKKSVLGKNVREVESAIAALPGFGGGKVAIWPIWLRSIPKNITRVVVRVE